MHLYNNARPPLTRTSSNTQWYIWGKATQATRVMRDIHMYWQVASAPQPTTRLQTYHMREFEGQNSPAVLHVHLRRLLPELERRHCTVLQPEHEQQPRRFVKNSVSRRRKEHSTLCLEERLAENDFVLRTPSTEILANTCNGRRRWRQQKGRKTYYTRHLRPTLPINIPYCHQVIVAHAQ